MKKSLLIVLSMLLVMGFATTVFAVHAEIPAETQSVVAKGTTQITLGGQVRVRGFYQNNLDFNDDVGDNYSILETSVRLKLDAQVTPNTQAMVEIRDTKTGGDDDFTWGDDSGGFNDSNGIYTKGGEAMGDGTGNLQFIQAWIQSKNLFGTPLGIKLGHMPIQLGDGLFFSHTKNGDDAILLFADPMKELHVALANVKFQEGTTTLNDDSNAYVALSTYKGAGFNLSGDVTYINDQDNGAAAGTQALHFWNVGLRGDTKVAGLGLKADVELQTGKLKATTETKYKGYAVLVGADYTVNNIDLGLQYAYGKGDDSDTSNKYEGFVTIVDNTWHSAYNPWVYEYRVAGGSGTTLDGISNTQSLRGTIGSKVTKDLSGKLYLWWLKVPDPGSNVDDEAGYEIDWDVKYKIDKNLTYFVEGGYLFAGDYYKTITGTRSPDNPWAVRHGVTLSF